MILRRWITTESTKTMMSPRPKLSQSTLFTITRSPSSSWGGKPPWGTVKTVKANVRTAQAKSKASTNARMNFAVAFNSFFGRLFLYL